MPLRWSNRCLILNAYFLHISALSWLILIARFNEMVAFLVAFEVSHAAAQVS